MLTSTLPLFLLDIPISLSRLSHILTPNINIRVPSLYKLDLNFPLTHISKSKSDLLVVNKILPHAISQTVISSSSVTDNLSLLEMAASPFLDPIFFPIPAQTFVHTANLSFTNVVGKPQADEAGFPTTAEYRQMLENHIEGLKECHRNRFMPTRAFIYTVVTAMTTEKYDNKPDSWNGESNYS